MTEESNKKVGLFLVGSRKCGTTSLANFLNTHNNISLSDRKEPNYFNQLHKSSLVEYHQLFNWNASLQLEASTSYTSHISSEIDIATEIYKYNPNAKIIYIIRDPIKRIVSHYRMSFERGDLQSTLDDAIVSHSLLIDCCKYYSHIKNYIDVFGSQNILILNNEDLNNIETENKLVSFLKLDLPFEKTMSTDNAADTDYRMPRFMDKYLKNKYYNLIKKVIPISFIQKLKASYYRLYNRKMSTTLNQNSKKIIKDQILPELQNIQSIIDFDITKWIEKTESL